MSTLNKNLDPKVQILINHVKSVPRVIISMEPLYYSGAIVGSEFETYHVQKIYLCIQLTVSGRSGNSVGGTGALTLYDVTDTVSAVHVDKNTSIDTAGANYVWSYNTFILRSILFSRVSRADGVTYFEFIGYKLTLAP